MLQAYKKLLLSVIILLPLVAKGQQLISSADLRKHLDNGKDTTYVIDFWATWCEPCIRELPVFEQLHRDSDNKKMKVLLVSIDKEKKLNNVLRPFIRYHDLKSKVFLLNEPKEFIHQLYPAWKGDLPLAVIYNSLKPESVKIITRPVKKEDFNFLLH